MQPIHITQGSGKLAGIQSINTSTLSNAYCSRMRETDSVCARCYAARYETMRPLLEAKLLINDQVLSECVIPWDALPYVNASIFRLHSFGELINTVHLQNFVNITLKNSHCTFALWTKRKEFVREFFDKHTKPANLILIYSSPLVGTPAPRPPYFDKVFTTFPKSDKGADFINCGVGLGCNECRLCYTHNTITNINEVIK